MAMHRFIDGEDRTQQALLPHSLEDYVDGENPDHRSRIRPSWPKRRNLTALTEMIVCKKPAFHGRPWQKSCPANGRYARNGFKMGCGACSWTAPIRRRS